VVKCLEGIGVAVVSSLEDISGEVVVIPSHGVSLQLREEIKARQLDVVDATCPIVRDAQRAAKELAEAGLKVIVFGEIEHPEVRGLLSYSGVGSVAALDVRSIDELEKYRHLGILSQTTQSAAKFARFVAELTEEMLPHVSELRVINTICDATRKRQNSAVNLARVVDVVLVVGGYNSANTRRLADICSATGVETHHIETADDIKVAWFEGRSRVGLTAGASTPNWLVEEVVEKLGVTDSDSID
jgi:4-hydroxy-3-methylbut-2-enyl diphosphate reductase